jgi:hypothetical protein
MLYLLLKSSKIKLCYSIIGERFLNNCTGDHVICIDVVSTTWIKHCLLHLSIEYKTNTGSVCHCACSCVESINQFNCLFYKLGV